MAESIADSLNESSLQTEILKLLCSESILKEFPSIGNTLSKKDIHISITRKNKIVPHGTGTDSSKFQLMELAVMDCSVKIVDRNHQNES